MIYLKGNDYWKKYYKKIGVEVHKISLKNNLNIFQFLLALNQIRKLINQLKPNVVHAHLLSMELIGAIINFNSKHKFKFIVTKHLDSFFFLGFIWTSKFFYLEL